MKNQDIITLEAVGEFPFTFFIEKAIPTEKDEELILEGIASTTNVDHDNERFSQDALRAMESAINDEGVPLRVEHQKEGDAIIGRVFKAWLDEREQLHIRARLDKTHPVSPILHHSMKNGVKMGLSVGGIVKRAVKEFVESTGGMIKTFYDVALQEVSVTPRPANYDSWLVAKSIAKDTNDAEEYSENKALRREFLLENSQLDYLQAFAKSVPDKAWRKVESPSKINKDDKTMKNAEKTENGTEETDAEKSVSRSEFKSLSKAFSDLSGLVSKGFENVGSILAKAMDGDAKDQVNPDGGKPDDESPTAKEMDSGAKDQNHPDEAKPEDESPAAKSEDETETEKTTDETEAEKAEDESTETKSAKKKTAKTDDQTYDMESVTRSIKTLNNLQKRLSGIKKTETETEAEKAEDDEDTTKTTDETDEANKAEDEGTETTKSQKHHPLDVFVATVTKMMESVVEKMEKSGKRVLGFEKSFIEDIQNSPEIQKEIAKLIKQPGFKKSVAMGVPYMALKDGRRVALTAVPEQVEKSTDEQPKDFKTLYKSQYSSVSPDTLE